jgi:hypothetical protein
VVVAANLGEDLGAKAQDPIDLDAPEAGESTALASRSSSPASDDFDPVAAKPADIVALEPTTTPETLQPEDDGMMFLLRDGFCVLPMNHALRLLKPLVFVLILAAKTLVTLSVKDREKDTPQTEMDPSASRTSLASMLGEPGMKLCLPLCFWCFDLVPSPCWLCEGI